MYSDGEGGLQLEGDSELAIVIESLVLLPL